MSLYKYTLSMHQFPIIARFRWTGYDLQHRARRFSIKIGQVLNCREFSSMMKSRNRRQPSSADRQRTVVTAHSQQNGAQAPYLTTTALGPKKEKTQARSFRDRCQERYRAKGSNPYQRSQRCRQQFEEFEVRS